MLNKFKGIGERLNLMLKLNKMTQKKACELTGISKNAMSNYINDNRVPEPPMLYKLARLFKTSMEWILTGENPTYIRSTESFTDYLRSIAEEIIESHLNLESDGEKYPASDEERLIMINVMAFTIEKYLRLGNGNSRVLVLTHHEYEYVTKFKQLSTEDKLAIEEFVNIKLRLAKKRFE